MLQRVDRRHDAAGTVPQQKHRQSGLARSCELHDGVDVVGVVLEGVDVEPFTVGLTTTAEIKRVDREAARGQLLCRPEIVATVGFDAMADHHYASRCCLGTPGTDKDLRSISSFDS